MLTLKDKNFRLNTLSDIHTIIEREYTKNK